MLGQHKESCHFRRYLAARCKDNYRYCATWASLSECKRNPDWMLVQCPVACDQCRVKCNNNNVECEDWAGQGECKQNPEYMNIYCKKVRNCACLHVKTFFLLYRARPLPLRFLMLSF